MTKKRNKRMIILIIVGVIAALIVAFAVFILVAAGREGYAGPFKELAVKRVVSAYRDRPTGEIVFYGASNFTYWYTMEDDLRPYIVQNHGFGGSTDADMIARADTLLYPYAPSVVVIQTGSNGLAGGDSLETALNVKREMYGAFLSRLPNATFVVMSGLPLPGRTELWANTQAANEFLREYCGERDNMIFADATELMLTADGGFRPEYFNKDGVHLNREGRDVWGGFIKDVLQNITEE